MLIYYIYINIIIYTHILYTYIYNIYFSYVPLSLSSTSFKLPAVSHSPRNYRVISSYVEATLREIRLYRCTMSIGYQCQRWKLYRSIKIYMNHRCSSRTKRIKGIRKLKIKKNNKKKSAFERDSTSRPTTVTLKIEQVTSFTYFARETTAKLSTSGSARNTRVDSARI